MPYARSLIAFTCLLMLAASPLVAADEAGADCEPSQPWMGYQWSESVRDAYDAAGAPGGADTCEGEHWDGEDNVQRTDPGSTGPCLGTSGESPQDLFLGLCQGPDPNRGAAEGPNPVASLTPASFRFSWKGSETGQEAYGSANVLFVGRFALYAGECHEPASGGLEGSSCDGARQGRAAVYWRDNTPGNLVFGVWALLPLDNGHAAEGDCDHATYNYSAMQAPPDRTLCGRDNTAFTLEWVLP